MRAARDHRGGAGHRRPRRRRGRLQRRLHLPQGHGHRRAAPRSGPAADAHGQGPAHRPPRPRVLGRGLRRSSAPAWPPCVAAHGPDSIALFLGNPNVHNMSSAFYLPAFIRALGTTQPLHGQHRRPVPEAGVLGPDVRHAAVRRRPRHRPHRLPAHPRRQPAGLERLDDDGARHARPPAGPAHSGADGSSSSTPSARGPLAPRTSTSRSGRAATRFLLAAIANVLVERGPRRPRSAAAHLADGSLDAGRCAPSRPSRPEAVAGDHRRRRQTRSAASPASWPPHRRPPSTGAWARPRRGSRPATDARCRWARSPRGWSTSSTS